jgi:hypothetical protein
MSDQSAYTECLDLAETKKILEGLKKPGKMGLWSEWSGEGGSDIEIKLENIPRDQLSTLQLPAFCPCFSVDGNNVERCKSESVPMDVLGGNAWVPPEYGGDTDVRFWIVDPVLKWPVFVSLRKRTDWRFFGRSFSQSVGLWAYVSGADGNEPSARSARMSYGPPPTLDAIHKFFKNLTEVHALPNEHSSALLETRVGLATPTKPVFEHDFEIGMFEELRGLFEQMVTKMIRNSMSEYYSVRAYSNIGRSAWFEGEMHNAREDALVFLRQIEQANDYNFYDITYHSLGPRSWKDREKSRKKWKKPVVEQMGTATLETGAVAQVRVVTEKEGYVFHLDFESADDLIKFYHSKLFKKTKWHSGAE